MSVQPGLITLRTDAPPAHAPAIRVETVQRGEVIAAEDLLSRIDRLRWWIFGTVALVYVLGFTGSWRPEPDSAFYLSLAKNVALGNGYTYQGEPNHLAYPGLPWLLAGTFTIFGTDNLFPAHTIML